MGDAASLTLGRRGRITLMTNECQRLRQPLRKIFARTFDVEAFEKLREMLALCPVECLARRESSEIFFDRP